MEQNLRICKVCRIIKQRIEVGKYNSKDKKYTDEHGKSWNGSTCPTCNSIRVKTLMNAKRTKNVENA
jgi:hypothetical protein